MAKKREESPKDIADSCDSQEDNESLSPYKLKVHYLDVIKELLHMARS